MTLTANKSGAKVDERAPRQCDADSFLTRTVASMLPAVHWVLASSQSSEHTDPWYLQHETAAKLSMIKRVQFFKISSTSKVSLESPILCDSFVLPHK